MIYEVWVEFDSDDDAVEDQHIGTFSTEDKAKQAVKDAWDRIEKEEIEDVADVATYTKELDVNYWV